MIQLLDIFYVHKSNTDIVVMNLQTLYVSHGYTSSVKNMQSTDHFPPGGHTQRPYLIWYIFSTTATVIFEMGVFCSPFGLNNISLNKNIK